MGCTSTYLGYVPLPVLHLLSSLGLLVPANYLQKHPKKTRLPQLLKGSIKIAEVSEVFAAPESARTACALM